MIFLIRTATKQKQNIILKVCCTLRGCYEFIFIILWDICLQFWCVKTWNFDYKSKGHGDLDLWNVPTWSSSGIDIWAIFEGVPSQTSGSQTGQINRTHNGSSYGCCRLWGIITHPDFKEYRTSYIPPRWLNLQMWTGSLAAVLSESNSGFLFVPGHGEFTTHLFSSLLGVNWL